MNDLYLAALKVVMLIASCGILAILIALGQDNGRPPHVRGGRDA